MSDQDVELPGTKLKVIGLISGGKDSCFNLVHCIANGHELVALATLQPADGIEELDSHIYQSVGTRIAPLIADAMGLPLYTGVIKGKALEQGPEYGDRVKGGAGSGVEGDETEDLTVLLEQVMAAHPEASAISSGAILSNYQRLRIEHVCQRLGLVSLAYLWQQAQLPLLDSMFACGLEPVIVKVAGEGLSIDLVGKPLREARPLLSRLERLYGSHPAGEGGEYETLTVDSPLFSKRLKFVETEVVVTDPEPYPVAYLKVGKAVLEPKEGWEAPTIPELRHLLGLEANSGALDEMSRQMLDEIKETQGTQVLEAFSIAEQDDSQLEDAVLRLSITGRLKSRFSQRGRWFAATVNGQVGGVDRAGEDVRYCLTTLSDTLASKGLSLPIHTAHVTLLLSSMSLFAEANAAYTNFFGTSPPSRATVAAPLPPGQNVRIEIIGYDSRDDGTHTRGHRQALHVQSLSYWAPANIGPYSQAVQVDGRLHIAGQIPLLPASLTLPRAPPSPESPYLHQAVLALQHVRRIIDVLRSKHNTGGGWQGWVENCTVWWARLEGHDEGLADIRRAWDLWAEEIGYSQAPVLFLQARELPKGALLEFQVNMNTGRRDTDALDSGANSDDDEADGEIGPRYSETGDSHGWQIGSCEHGKGSGTALRAFAAYSGELPSAPPGALRDLCRRSLAVRCYARPGLLRRQTSTLEGWWESLGTDIPCISYIPVLDVHDSAGKRIDLALDFFGG